MAQSDYNGLNKLLLVGGVVTLFWPQIKALLAANGIDVTTLLAPLTPKPTTGAGLVPPTTTDDASGGAVGPNGPGNPSSQIGTIGGAAATGAGIATAAGAGALTVGIATGIGAVAALLAWGILKEGWFRGGEEGVVVNPARDQFLRQFAPFDYLRDSSNPPGFYGLAWLLTSLGKGDGGGPLFDAVIHSHTKDAFTHAVNDVLAVVRANQAAVARLYDYATKDASAPQRAVTPL